jgi:hypothetical protein
VREAGDRCCAPWARTGARWRAVDASGQIAGEVRIAGGEGYDVTQCYELEFAATSGSLGVGLFVEASSGWRPPPPATWTPAAAEFQDSCRLVNQACFALDFEDPLSYSGLRQTTRTGFQLRAFPDQRSGWRRRAAS